MDMRKLSVFVLCLAAVSCGNRNAYDAAGNFEATEVIVSAEQPGKIMNLDVDEGDSVEVNEMLGTIDTVQLYLQKKYLEKQQASVMSNRPDTRKQVASLRAQIAKQEKERDRVENLLKDGAATTKQLDDIQAQLDVLHSQLDATLSTLNKNTASIDENASALEIQIEQVEDKLAKCRIASPISGTILAKYVEEGEFVSAGKPLFKVANLDKIYLRAYFTSDQMSKIKLGQKVTVIADFGGGETIEIPGEITWIASDSEFTPKNIQTKNSRANLVYATKIAVHNDGRLKIGLYGEVRL
jgi:HlyD family secretion protein